MDSDDFGLPRTRKAPVRKGRRAAPPVPSSLSSDTPGSTEYLDDPSSSGPASLNKGLKGPIAPPRSRRTGGWADETLKSAKCKQVPNSVELEQFQSPERRRQDSDDDIPVIPDLDDVQDEELTSQIVKAPSVIVNRVATYKELDSDLFKHAAFATLDDVNLRLLTKHLNLENDIREPDSCWTWDLLFTDVASDLNTELESNQTSTSSA